VILPDVNVLIYAFRSDSVDHSRYKAWIETVVNGPQAYGIAPQTLAALVRITTHPKIYAKPSRAREAFAFSRALLEQPNATSIVPGERHWSIFEDLCLTTSASGNLVQDAWFAALAMESGCEWITTDQDFAKFPGLKARAPW